MINVESSFLPKTAIEYANLSDFAYADWMPAGINNWVLDPTGEDYAEYLKKWTDVSNNFNNRYKVVSHYATDSTDFSATLFQDKETGKYVLAIRGTDSLQDVFDPDVDILNGKMPAGQFESLVNYISQIRTIFGNIAFDVTGHSLGGFLAQVVKAAFSNIGNVYTYNAPGARKLVQYVNEGIQPNGKVKVSVPGGSLFSSFEWSQATWNAYQNYIASRNSSEMASNIYNISGKDGASATANKGTDIGMEVFIDGAGHGIKDVINTMTNSRRYFVDPIKPVTVIGSKKDEMFYGNYASGHYIGPQLSETLVGGYGNDILIGGDGNDVIYGDLPQNIIDNVNDELKKSGNEGGYAGNDQLEGGKGNDTLYGGAGFDTYVYKLGDGNDKIIDEDSKGRIVIKAGTLGAVTVGVGNLYKSASGTTWTNASGTIFSFIPGNNKIVFNDGGSIELAANFQPGDFGINLINTPDNPTTTNPISGDLTPIDFDPNEEGIQTQTDEWGNIRTDSNSPEQGRVDVLYDTTGNDRITAGDGNDSIFSSRGGNDWLLGGNGDDYVMVDHYQTNSGNDILEGNAGSDIVEGGKGKDKVFGGDYGEMEQLIAAGETAEGINARGDVVSGGEGDDYVYGSNSIDALFGGLGKDLLAGGGGDDVIIGDDNYFAAVRDWSYSITTTPSGNTNIYGLTFSGISGGLDATSAIGDDDVIYGGTGNDYIDGVGGDDEIYGGTGNDSLFGSAGNDFIEGGIVIQLIDKFFHRDAWRFVSMKESLRRAA